jgi:phosphatidate cytidylyltransferase
LTRVLSALVLLIIVVGAIWTQGYETLLLALVAAGLAHHEYAGIATALATPVLPGSGIAVVLTCFMMATVFSPATALLLAAALLVVGSATVASGRPGPNVLGSAAASIFSAVYIGLPLGALVAVRYGAGREAILLLLVVIVVSDSAQYYTGRAFGRHKLAPEISPKKTVEGAVGGVVFATAAMALLGRYVLPAPVWVLAPLGAVLSLLGIVGDLFESLLKRSAGLKDSSRLIPGHGGVLDRIDSWLFAGPVYYVFVRYVTHGDWTTFNW